MKPKTPCILAAASLALCSFAAQAALLGRDLDTGLAGFEAYYDDVLNITWLADWNYAKTSGFDSNGLMNWDTANTWIGTLNAGSGLYGFKNWRLPTGDGNQPAGLQNEYKSLYDTVGDILVLRSYFSNLMEIAYWSGTQDPLQFEDAWAFRAYGGEQRTYNRVTANYAVAVRSGDVVLPVPLPAAAWLLLSGLVGLGAMVRRKTH